MLYSLLHLKQHCALQSICLQLAGPYHRPWFYFNQFNIEKLYLVSTPFLNLILWLFSFYPVYTIQPLQPFCHGRFPPHALTNLLICLRAAFEPPFLYASDVCVVTLASIYELCKWKFVGSNRSHHKSAQHIQLYNSTYSSL